MSYVLDTTTTDTYQYLECPGTSRVTVLVSNAGASIGFGQMPDARTFRPGSATYPPSDEPYLPTQGAVARACDEIRVKSYAPGTPADVKIVAQ